MTLRALDLFCGAGGAAMGLHRAGFEVTGVDILPMPRYPFTFVQADALEYPLDGFDFVWASPPCQRYSMFSRNTGTAKNHPDLIAPVRERLERCGGPYVIENVVGAPLRSPVVLCGTMFGLKLIRHRLFETSFDAFVLLVCGHDGSEVPVYGNGTSRWHQRKLGRNVTIEEKRAAMGIDWMNRNELSNAIPPAYSEWIARRWLSIRKAA